VPPPSAVAAANATSGRNTSPYWSDSPPEVLKQFIRRRDELRRQIQAAPSIQVITVIDSSDEEESLPQQEDWPPLKDDDDMLHLDLTKPTVANASSEPRSSSRSVSAGRRPAAAAAAASASSSSRTPSARAQASATSSAPLWNAAREGPAAADDVDLEEREAAGDSGVVTDLPEAGPSAIRGTGVDAPNLADGTCLVCVQFQTRRTTGSARACGRTGNADTMRAVVPATSLIGT